MFKQVNGTYDYLPLDCYSQDKLASIILKVFADHGYRQIDTPILERYELFNKENVNIDSNKLFKLTDSDGSILVMRPDMTLPIARVVTTKLQDPLRNKYCYLADSFSYKQQGNDIREFTQAGIELFSPGSIYADADIISLAIDSLLSVGLKDFIIDIGHVGYFKGLLAALNLNADDEQDLIKLVNAKDSFGIELFAQSGKAPSDMIKELLSLPTMFGGSEVIDQAIGATSVERSLQSLNELKGIVTILKSYGYDKYISIDLSLVNGISYYSGVVFNGMSKYLGTSILGGGRYDNLTEAFGKRLDATGFAIGVNNLLEACRRESDIYRTLPPIDLLVGGNGDTDSVVHNYIEDRISEGMIVERSYIDNILDFKSDALRIRAKRSIFIDNNGNIIEL